MYESMNRCFENVAQFRYLGMNVTNANYHSVQNFLSSCLLHKNIKIRIYKTMILPVFLYGCETWCLMLREEHKLEHKNRVLRRIFGLKSEKVTGGWRKLLAPKALWKNIILFYDYIFKIQYAYCSNSCSLGFGNIHVFFMLQCSLESKEEPSASDEEQSNMDNEITDDRKRN
jgi:hypothetical protein